MLVGDSRAKAEPRAPLQQTETETQPVEPSETPRQVPPTESTSPRRHPSRRQRRRMKRMEQQEAGSTQRQPVSGTGSPAMDVPVAVSETLPPRRWERADLRTESADCSPSVGPPAVPTGLAPAEPSDGQRVTTQAVMYIGSLFVPGRVAGKTLSFLVDTGCTHNLLSRTVFDRLPAQTRQQMVYGETVAAMADGSGLHIYGSIGLSGRLRNVPFEARFLVCRISDNAILGMEFLRRHDCSVACDKG